VIVVEVPLGERSYDVVVGDGARHHLPAVLPPGVRRAAVVTQAGVGVSVDPGCESRVFVIGDGETAKSMATVENLCSQWAQWGLTRGDVVVAVGGGLVTDVAGFAASVYHRGVPVVFVATTLLAQIDAAIGGKTGVNLPEGKNLVGSFWQPTAVLCDTEVLRTLPDREVRNGFGELAKYRFLGLATEGATSIEDPALPETVAACVAIKAAVVADDERESGRRAILNYGHTLAHALEIDGGFDLRHGEAVAIGLVFAARLGHALGRIDADAVNRHVDVVAGYGLPTTLPLGARPGDLVALMARDKKAIDGLTFVLDGAHGVEPVSGVAVETVTRVLEDMP
jgi:5-deoxy-5-amino-3-dehydroquinate synthase